MLNKAIGMYLRSDEHEHYIDNLISEESENHVKEHKEMIDKLDISQKDKVSLDSIFNDTYILTSSALYKRGFYDCLNMLNNGFKALNERDIEETINDQREASWERIIEQSRVIKKDKHM